MAAGTPRTPKPKPKPRPRKRDDDDEGDDDFGGGDDDDDDNDLESDSSSGSISAGATGPAKGLLEVSAAFGLASRSYELTNGEGVKVGKYTGAFYPEFALALEVYPLTLAMRGWPAGFGLGAYYSRHVSISTNIKEDNSSVDTSTQEIQATIRYRWLISDTLSGPQLYGVVGWGHRAFSLSENPILASFAYHYILGAVGGRVPIGTPLFGVSLEASVRPVLKVGQDAVNSYGTKGGGFAFSVKPGVYGQIWMLRYFVEFEFAHYSMDFSGLDPSYVRPDTIDTESPTDGTDIYLRTWAGVAFVY